MSTVEVNNAFIVSLICEDIPIRVFKSSKEYEDKRDKYERLTGFHNPDFLLETRINTYTKSYVKGVFQRYLAQNDRDRRIIDIMFRLCEETYNPGEPRHENYDKFGFYCYPCQLKGKEKNIRELRYEAEDIAEMISSVLYYANDEYPRELDDGYFIESVEDVVKKYCDLRHSIDNDVLDRLDKIANLVEEYHKKQCLW